MELYIHIGLPKTGVTLLSHIFQSSKKINFLGRPLEPIFDELWQSMIFDNDKNYKKKLLKKKNLIIKSLSKSKKNILLIEGITDAFFILNSKQNFLKRLNYLRKIFLGKLKIKIVFSLRKQSDFFVSRYVESSEFFENYIFKWKDFDNFKRTFKKKNLTKKEKKFLNNFNYFKVCNYLFKNFNRKNVNILLYEELKIDKDKFSKKLSKLFKLNIKETSKYLKNLQLNQSIILKKNNFIRKKSQSSFLLTNNSIYIKFNKKIPRVIKNIFKSFFVSIDKFYYRIFLNFKPKNSIYLNQTDIGYIKNFYLNDNKKIDKYFKIGLKKYNYY